jgi:DNA polymerase
VVFGVGPAPAEVMFVGEGPGENEDIQGEPFVGRAGQFLDEMLYIIGLSRRNCYIANVIKCRPENNRDPLSTERDACSDWLNAQIKLVSPKIIICLGRFAAMELISPDFKITREHGRWFEINGTQRMAMYHPSALLRDPDKRPDTFRDLKSLQAMVKEYCPNTKLEP